MSEKTPGHPVLDRMEAELDRLWGFALRLTRDHDDAADLVQRTCTRAIERRTLYDPSLPLRSWLYRIAHNLWINEVRKRNVERRVHESMSHDHSHPLEAPTTVRRGVETAPENSALLADVERSVMALPEAQRQVLLLVAVEGFSYQEAAEILDIPIGTIMSRLARARLAIGLQFIEHGSSATRSNVTSITELRKQRQDHQ